MMSEEKILEEETPKEGSLAVALYEWLQVVVGCLTAIVLLFLFVGRILYVDGDSMVPTLHNRDVMVVQELGYTPHQGDVVVLTQEFRTVTGPIVKRVIATGGQTVDIDYAAGTVTVDGEALDEPYINYEPMQVPWYEDYSHITVPEGQIFVMGDNRNHSNDSRDKLLGTVDTRRVIGRAVTVLFPVQDFGIIG